MPVEIGRNPFFHKPANPNMMNPFLFQWDFFRLHPVDAFGNISPRGSGWRLCHGHAWLLGHGDGALGLSEDDFVRESF